MPSSSNIPTELGTESIGKLLKKYAIPAIIAMTASSLYNVVDSIFIGHGVGALGLSGLALSFPLMNLSTAIGTLAGVGASTMISVLLGRADTAGAKSVLGNQITLKIIISILFTIICLLFLDPILTFFGASEATLPYAREYMEVILIGNIFTHLYFGLINTVRASGNPKVSMWMTIFTVFFNALINPLFIFALDLGIKGAAIATVLSQAIALVFLIRFMYTRGGEFMKLKFKDLALDLSIVKRIFSIGISPFLLNSAACLVAIFVNQQLSKYSGDIGIAAYGIVNRITFLVVMIILGFSQGMQPIAGYNYGACKYSRMRKVYKLTAAAATIVSIIGFLIAQFIPKFAVSLFTNDPELIELSSRSLSIVGASLFLIGFQAITSNFYVCIGMIHKSILLTLSRQIIMLLPLIYILPLYMGDTGVWISFPIADSLSFILTVIVSMLTFKQLNKLKDGEAATTLRSKL